MGVPLSATYSNIPYDADAERAVLGACLASGGAPLDRLAFLAPDDFWVTAHRDIYDAMWHLYRDHGKVDLVLLFDLLRRRQTLSGDHAEGYVISLTEAASSAEGVVEHARIVKREAGRRHLIGIGRGLARLARDERAGDVCQLYDRALAALQKHYPALTSEEHPSTWADLDGILSPIAWEWQNWLPRGFLTLLVGESGAGKSILALHLCTPFLGVNALWPDDTVSAYSGEPGDVLWVEAEEAQWLNWERARAWDLPIARIRTPFADPMHEVRLDNPAHRKAIERALRRAGVRFAVVDSLSGASQGDENSIEVLGVVKWLAALARDTGKAVLLLHHLRKPGLLDGDGRSELARVRGHSSIVQPTRVVLSLDTPDPADLETRRLRVVKNNIGPLPDPLGLRITGQGIRFCEAPRPPQRVSALDRAARALLAALAAGPRPVQGLREEFETLGIPWITATRAKKEVGVVSMRVGKNWQWALPTEEDEVSK